MGASDAVYDQIVEHASKVFDEADGPSTTPTFLTSTLPGLQYLSLQLPTSAFPELVERLKSHTHRSSIRLCHDGENLLTVKFSTTSAHDTAPTHFFLKLSATQRAKVGDVSSRVGLVSLASISVPVGKGRRGADATLIPRLPNSAPTVILESGFTENITQAQATAKVWLLTPGSTIQLVILILLGTAPQGIQTPQIIIQHWIKDPSDPSSAKLDWQADWSSESGITGYSIPLDQMYIRGNIPSELASPDGKLTITTENIRHWRDLIRTVWGATKT